MRNQQFTIFYEKGIDISKWQGEIDWEKVAAAEIKHAVIKMSEGGTYFDLKFIDNWNAAKTAGLKLNVYHYFRALSSSSEDQFANIKKNLLSIDFDPKINCLAIDVESRGNESASSDVMANHLQKLLNLLECDVKPMIYCSPAYWDNSVNWKKYDFSRYPLWIAHWNVEKPSLPKSWEQSGKSWVWWQYNSKGRVNGIEGDVDLNKIKIKSKNCLNL